MPVTPEEIAAYKKKQAEKKAKLQAQNEKYKAEKERLSKSEAKSKPQAAARSDSSLSGMRKRSEEASRAKPKRSERKLDVTVGGGAKADTGPKKPTPVEPVAQRRAGDQKAAKPKSAKKDWAAKEAETLKQDRITQKARQTANAYESGKRTAKRMDGEGGKLQSRMQKAGANLRKLSEAVKPSKSGLASYQDFMGG